MIASNSARTQSSSAYTRSANASSTQAGFGAVPGGSAIVLAAADIHVRPSSKVMAITVSITGAGLTRISVLTRQRFVDKT
jgi:hypothetical protein